MEHSIKDFALHCDQMINTGQQEYTRNEVKGMLHDQIARISNDITYILQGDLTERDREILTYLNNPRCTPF